MAKTDAKTQKQLDQSLKETFPASDPVAPPSVTSTEPPGSRATRKPPQISAEDVEAAAAETETCPMCHGTGKVVKARRG